MSNIIPVLMAIALFIFPITTLVGLITIIISFFNKDELKKKKLRKIGLWVLFGPMLLVIVLVTLFGITGAIPTI